MHFRHFQPILLLACFGLALLSCRQEKGRSKVVTASILPQEYFIRQIAGDYLQVNIMIPPGMNPATCDLNTEQLKKLHDSDICFLVGHLPFEQIHLAPVLEKHKEIRTVDLSEGLELIKGSCSHSHGDGNVHRHAGVDPHIWLSPVMARKMADGILKALVETYPEKAEDFRRNHAALEKEIGEIGRLAKEVLGRKKDRTFLIYHPALTYFAADYGMEQVAIENEGKEPNPTHLRAIIDQAREKHIGIIFIQSQFDISNARSVAREIGAEVIQIDPLNPEWNVEMRRMISIMDQNLADR